MSCNVKFLDIAFGLLPSGSALKFHSALHSGYSPILHVLSWKCEWFQLYTRNQFTRNVDMFVYDLPFYVQHSISHPKLLVLASIVDICICALEQP